ncbi:MAG: PAS domain S-box protein [Opitutaceae bacterium]|nr:PAS domain S-box protein [Opitutaceae bacterium]
MSSPLRVLMVEDSADDARLMVRTLQKAGYDVTWERTETAEAMQGALARQPWEVILVDYNLPKFSGLEALRIAKSSRLDTPLILVSGSVGEETAVEAMRAGAHDYVMKDRLARLAPAVARELREAELRRQRLALEARMREEEARYRALVEKSHEAVCVLDGEGRTNYASPSTEQILGYRAEEIIGRTAFEFVYPEDLAMVQADFADLKQRIGDDLTRELRCVRRDGAVRWFDVVATNLMHVASVKGIVVNYRDVTERKQAEAALREEQAMFNSLTSTIPDHIYFKDRQSRFVRINASLARHFGLHSPDEAAGKTDFNFFGEEHARRAYEYEQRLMRTGEALIDLEEKEIWPDGHVTWASTTKVPLRDADGTINGLVGISRDITERKQAEERIREQAAMLDQASDAIYVTDLDCTILNWNRAAERIYGWPAAEAIGRKTTELISCSDPLVASVRANVIEKGECSGERRQTTKVGRPVEVFSRLTLLHDDRGRPRAILVINTDITEKKELEARFLRAQRLESVGALASGIAHDLNNVLAPIIMGAPLLRDSVKEENARKLLALIETSARRGADIVKQVLTFARGTEGQRVSLQPKHLVRDMLKITAETFPKNIQVEDESAAEVRLVEGDATQLHQALMNFCVNARDAMPDGGRLTVAAENVTLDEAAAAQMPGAHAGRYVRLRVSDTGGGIPPEVQNRMFEPFFTTKGLGKGTGLGLSTAMGIAKGHGGFVRFCSQVGKGTTFAVYLPAAPAGEQPADARSMPPWPLAAGELVLLVDDESAVREVACQALTEFGYRVISCAGGAEAIVQFRASQSKVRLVVTDMMMPEMDGPTLVKALRAIAPGVPIVGITGVSDTATMSRLRALALSALLAKPFTIGQFLPAVHAAMQPGAGSAT